MQQSKTGATPAYMSLRHQYGYDDNDMDFGGSSNNKEQTVEQEYRAYATAPLLPKSTDILNFGR